MYRTYSHNRKTPAGEAAGVTANTSTGDVIVTLHTTSRDRKTEVIRPGSPGFALETLRLALLTCRRPDGLYHGDRFGHGLFISFIQGTHEERVCRAHTHSMVAVFTEDAIDAHPDLEELFEASGYRIVVGRLGTSTCPADGCERGMVHATDGCRVTGPEEVRGVEVIQPCEVCEGEGVLR